MKRFGFSAFVVVFCFILVLPIAYAYEMYPGLRWHDAPINTVLNHRVIYLATNGDYLGTTFQNQMPTTRTKWNAFSDNRVSAYNQSFSTSKVDYATHVATWPSAWKGLDAITLVYDTNGKSYISGDFSGNIINYAHVYIHSNVSSTATSAEALRLLVHETGHVMNLGHPDDPNIASVMQTPTTTYDTPQNYDRDTIKLMYPN